ncbi:MAG: nitronate monooxygenase [Clostridia bacterium]|nr:nitronate monooxygenase [Clostridia bacterium]
MIKSAICDMLAIKYPIFQGAMAWIADASLASAVSEGGGLGIISAMNSPAEYLHSQIAAARRVTDKPLGVNVMLMSPYAEEVAALLCEEPVDVITTGAGNPSKYIPMWKSAGKKVIPVVASVAVAKIALRAGADALIAEGGESGGHVGDLTTMVLVPQIAEMTDVPVIAAGGIYDGRSLAAAMMLGACGAQMGTRFLCAHECSVHANYKEKILKAKDVDTITTGKRLGHPVRSLKTPFSREFLRQEYDSSVSNEALEALGGGALYRAAVKGDVESGCFMAGQVAAMVKEEMSAAEIISDVVFGAQELLKGASEWVS